MPTVLLGAWGIETSMWDGEVMAGPVPTLFLENAKNSEDGLKGRYKLWMDTKVR